MAFAENSVLTRRDTEMKYEEDEGNCFGDQIIRIIWARNVVHMGEMRYLYTKLI
jgi:hypothetical protein